MSVAWKKLKLEVEYRQEQINHVVTNVQQVCKPVGFCVGSVKKGPEKVSKLARMNGWVQFISSSRPSTLSDPRIPSQEFRVIRPLLVRAAAAGLPAPFSPLGAS